MPDSVDAATVRRWCAAGLDALRRHQDEIDALNVYPVPDGDTGTNLVLTMSATVDALHETQDDALGSVLRAAARGALLGARGNSGIILAQLFKGLAETLAAPDPADAAQLARALEHAARTAYRAVAAPVEGTVLSVGAAAARAALAAAGLPTGAGPGGLGADGAGSGAGGQVGPGVPVGGSDRGLVAVARAGAGGQPGPGAPVGGSAGDLVAVARAAADGARVALARTPEQLPALARAGVVDAGGRGLVVLLDALVQTLTGEAPPPVPSAPAGPVVAAGQRADAMEREAGSDEYAYEVQYLLEAGTGAVDGLRATLSALGDSLVVVGEDPTWHVHVHVNDVGAAIEAGIDAGRPSRITVTRFADQVAARAAAADHAAGAAAGYRADQAAGVGAGYRADQAAGAGAGYRADQAARAGYLVGGDAGAGARYRADGDEGPGSGDRADAADDAQGESGRLERAVVVVCSGPGLGDLLAAEGATVVTGTPSTGEILAAIRRTGASRVVVLPNDPNVQAVAAAAAAEARAGGVRAGVVPTRSPVQALAAMAVRDARRRFADDVIAMAEAAARCRSAEVTIASREALTVAGRCQPGDVLAIVDGEVNLIGRELSHTASLLLDRMLAGGGELVTLIVGQGAPAELGETLRGHVARAWPFVEVQCYEGGQPHYPLLVGVE